MGQNIIVKLAAVPGNDLVALFYITFQRFYNIVSEWAPSTARWVKMAMKVLGTGNGVLRPPYLLPPESDQQRMAEAFAAMRLMEIEAEVAAERRVPGVAK